VYDEHGDIVTVHVSSFAVALGDGREPIRGLVLLACVG
jgi:hypothetical protein